MADYGLPYIEDKSMFAAAMLARRQISEFNERPSVAIAQAASRFKVNEGDVGHYACMGVAWDMIRRTMQREGRSGPPPPVYAANEHRYSEVDIDI